MSNKFPAVRLLPRPKRRRVCANRRVSVSRRFLRLTGKEMDPLAFRIMCHGLTYPTGWSVRRCVRDTGYSKSVVYIHLHNLIDSGHIKIVRNKNGKRGFRFFPEPSSAPTGDSHE